MTRSTVETLRIEAGAAGDEKLVASCDGWLAARAELSARLSSPDPAYAVPTAEIARLRDAYEATIAECLSDAQGEH